MNNLFFHAQNRKNIQRTLLGLIIVLSLMMGSSLPAAQAQEGGAPELFSDAGTADVARDNRAHVMRSRLVNVNFGLLLAPKGQALDASVNPEITLNLFPDATFTGVIERVEQNSSGSKSWIGSLKEKEGYFYLVASSGAFIAHVGSKEGGFYEVSLAGESLYKVVQIDQSQLKEDAPGLVDREDPVLLDANLDVSADAASPIDVMVVYTDDARAAEGSTPAMWARIDLAMTETKTAYVNAGVVPRLRLVHVEEVNYAESGFLDTDLTRLLNPSDGQLDAVHTLRNIYGADMVALVVENATDGCGLAADILASASTAFQVTARDGCMTGNYSFGHEFGHLQGARHDLYVDSTSTPYAFGHGYVNTTDRWRTVMAYNNKCTDTAPGTYCPRLQFFSNPNKTYLGAATGAAGSSENFKVLNATALTVANFRTAKIGKAFNSTFNATAAPWKPVVGAWAISNAAYLTSPGVANTYSSIQFPSPYADLTFQAKLYRKGCVTCSTGLFIRGNPASLGVPEKWWQPSYEFDYSNNGYFLIYKNYANGSFVLIKNWTSTTAINKGGWNTLKVVAVGKLIKFYINGILVYQFNDPSFRIGRVGIHFWRDAATTNRLFVDYARLINTPTGGVSYDERVDDSGVTVEGGTRYQSP